MEILELELQHYGKFDHHRISLEPGVNVIYGGNESGKTTVHSFIRAMLFGLNRGRGKAARSDEYQVRQPWDSPGAFLGSMRIRSQGQIYRIDRCFDRSAQPLRVTCETTMWEAPQPEKALEVLLGGVSETAFVNTLCIPQAGAETGEALAQELRRYMINSESAQNGQMDVSRALQELRRRKKQAEQKKKREDEILEARIAKRQARAEQLRAEISLLEQKDGRRDGTGREYADPRRDARGGPQGYAPQPAQSPEQEESASGEYARFYRKSRWLIGILLCLAGVLALAAAYFLSDLRIRILLAACGVLFLASIYPVCSMLSGEEENEAEDDGTEEELRRGELRQRDAKSGEYGRQGPAGAGEYGRQERRDPYLQAEIRSRREEYWRLQNELEALYRSHVRPDDPDTEIAALTLAIDRICELSSDIYAQSGRRLNERASGILSELTEGRYQRILLDETAEVRIHTPSRVLGLHQVSGGTMQQIYFALRMAAAELLCGDRRLPILLDEPFALYDDARLEAALRWLRKSGRQVILFSCQRREKEMLERLS